MSAPKRIFLVGPMGTGKTTIGSQLARALKLRFVDSDQELEARTGASISLIFDIEGEAGFRQREKDMIDELTLCEDIVLATGGGAILDEDNRCHLKERGFVVYLKSSIDKLVERTRYDHNRPLLKNGDPQQILSELMALREPLYMSIADTVVDTGNLSVKQIIRHISRTVP